MSDQAGDAMTLALNEIPAEDFEVLIGKDIACRCGSDAITLRLEGVKRSTQHGVRQLPGFSVFLRGPDNAPLGQGMLELQHPQLGKLELFMTPIARDADGLRYEIVFN